MDIGYTFLSISGINLIHIFRVKKDIRRSTYACFKEFFGNEKSTNMIDMRQMWTRNRNRVYEVLIYLKITYWVFHQSILCNCQKSLLFVYCVAYINLKLRSFNKTWHKNVCFYPITKFILYKVDRWKLMKGKNKCVSCIESGEG